MKNKKNKNNSKTPEKRKPKKERMTSPEHLREGTPGYKTE